MILVSYCKLGLKCNYKGNDNINLETFKFLNLLLKKGLVLGVCPEIFGGLSTPRDPSEIINGNGFDVLIGKAKVYSNKGIDVTSNFILGAKMCLDLAKKYNVKAALLNEFSPSCGINYIYDGTFTKTKIPGVGVLTAALLNEFNNKIVIYDHLNETNYNYLVNIFDN